MPTPIRRFARLAAVSAIAVMAAVSVAKAQDATAELTGDPAKGAKIFNKCKACHTIEKGEPKRIGPNLYGIVGAPFGRREDFNYSDNLLEMKAAGAVWDLATLDAYIENPKKVIPKGIMSFAGVKKDTQRADLFAYLATFSDDAAPEAAQ